MKSESHLIFLYIVWFINMMCTEFGLLISCLSTVSHVKRFLIMVFYGRKKLNVQYSEVNSVADLMFIFKSQFLNHNPNVRMFIFKPQLQCVLITDIFTNI